MITFRENLTICGLSSASRLLHLSDRNRFEDELRLLVEVPWCSDEHGDGSASRGIGFRASLVRRAVTSDTCNSPQYALF